MNLQTAEKRGFIVIKQNRHAKIAELIKERNIETQEELTSALKEAGFEVTQATVSRDIKAMKLVKVAAYDENGVRKGYKYSKNVHSDSVPELAEKYRNLLKDVVVKADYACNLAVIKTYSGMANAAAAAIDAIHNSGIVGSVAGDDTVLCVLKTEENAKEFIDVIEQSIF